MAGRFDGWSVPRSPPTWSTDAVACTPPGASAGPAAARDSELCPKSFGQVGSGSGTRSPSSASSWGDPLRSPRSGGVIPGGHAIGSAGSFHGASSGAEAGDTSPASADPVAPLAAVLPLPPRTSPPRGSPACPPSSSRSVRSRASGASEPSAPPPAVGDPAAGDTPSGSVAVPNADAASVAGSPAGLLPGPTSVTSTAAISSAPAAAPAPAVTAVAAGAAGPPEAPVSASPTPVAPPTPFVESWPPAS
jgi:collagen type IV alpha